MKKLILSLAFASFSLLVFCQSSLTGYITIQNSKGKSAFPAQVKSFGATETVANQNDGKFNLVYDKKKPGQSATLEIERNGYEVVNKKDLSVTIPKDGKAQRPIKFFLCPKGQWRKYADQYYKTNIQQINNSYERQLQKIQKQYESVTLENIAYRQALFDLDEKRKVAEAQAEEMAERFAKTNLDDATDRFVQAHRLFTSGKLDSVILLLNEKEILADFKKAEKEIASGNKLVQIGKDKLVNGLEAKEKIVEEFMIKARAHIIKLQWEEAERTYEIATTVDSLNFDNLFEYGYYIYEQYNPSKAALIFERCLKLTNDEMNQVVVLNLLGLAYNENFDFQKSESNLLKALKIVEKYSESKKEILTSTLTHLGRIYKANYDFQSAEKYYLRSLNIKKAINSEDDIDSQASIGNALVNMANIYRDNREFVKSQQKYDEALAIFKSLSKEKVEEYDNNLGLLQLNLANFHIENKKDFKQAEFHVIEALQIFQKLVNKNPKKYEFLLAETYHYLGIVNMGKEDFEKAEQNTLEAIRLYEKLANNNPQVHQFSIGRNLSLLASIYSFKKDYSKVEEMHLKAIRIFEILAKENPKGMTMNLSSSEFLYGMYFIDMFEMTGDEKYKGLTKKWFEKARKNLDIFQNDFEPKINALALIDHGYEVLNNAKSKKSAVSESDNEIAITLYNQAVEYLKQEEFEVAEFYFLESLGKYTEMAKLEPEKFNHTLAIVLYQLGLTNFHERDFTKADEFLLRSLKVRNQINMEQYYDNNIAISQVYLLLGLNAFDHYRFTVNPKIKNKSKEWRDKSIQSLDVYSDDYPKKIDLLKGINELTSALKD